MAQAKEASLRLKIIAGRGEGASYAALARDYKVNYHTVRTLCLRYEAQGESALRPNYSKCGRRVEAGHEKCFRLVRLLKRLHPSWGVPYIIARIKERYPALPLQSTRHYQRRLGLATGKVPKATLPKAPAQSRPRQPHDEWEVDAKERIEFDGGKQKACFLNITDAKTNAQLKAGVFPPGQDQSGTPGPDSATIARSFHTMGNTQSHPQRQRRALWRPYPGCNTYYVALVNGMGHPANFEPPQATPGQPSCREQPRHLFPLGRGV